MATFHKVTFEFESTTGSSITGGSKAGWSESWYDTEESEDADAAVAADALRLARRGMLTPGWAITGQRLARWTVATGLQRKAILSFYTGSDAIGLYPYPDPDEQPYDALVFRANTVGALHASRDLRGIPQSVVAASGRYTPSGGWVIKFSQFQDALLGVTENFGVVLPGQHRWGLRIRTLDASYVVLSGTIIDVPGVGSFTQSSPGIQVSGTFGSPAGSTIVVRGTVGFNKLNGTWLFDRVVGTQGGNDWVRLKPKRRVYVTGASTAAGGTAKAYRYSLDAIATIFGEYGSSRRTGRPTMVPRGRRSAQFS
jgi:hypothetical protein